VSALRAVLAASRPISWVNTALPFFAAAYEVERGPTPLVVLGVLYFLLPFNLLMYGVNDVFDYASDVANPRKQSVEGALVPPDRRRLIWAAVTVANVPFLVGLALLAPPAGTLAVLAAAGAAWIYSAPPLRTKERPFLDSVTSASHFVLPAIAGFLVTGLDPADLPWAILAGFLAWGIASHAIGAIQDIAYDRAAGIGSIATAIGARRTALVALAGYAVAVLAALSLGLPYGPIAAAVLALFLLLPAAVLAAPTEAQARRAWRSFLGLNPIAGFVLTLLLLRHWGLSTDPVGAVWAGATVGAVGLVLANLVLTELLVRRGPPLPAVDPADGPGRDAAGTGRDAAAPGAGGPLPPLTVIVPVRDEATRIPALLAALAAQDHPDLAILVADDASSDGSATLASAELARLRPAGAASSAGAAGRDRVLAVPPKPPGWAGKSWACDRAAAEATTPHLLFLDADTIPRPDACRALASELARSGAALVSGVSAYAMPTWRERAFLPLLPATLFGFLPLWLLRLAGGRPRVFAFAYGPLLLVDRAAYLRAGGHARVPGSEREDLDLARTIVAAGERVHLARAADLAVTRHYPDGTGALRAWRRVFVAYGGGNLAVAVAGIAGAVVVWTLPLLLPILGALSRDTVVTTGGLVALGLLAAFRLLLAWRERQPLPGILLHPVTVIATLGAMLLSLYDAVRGRPATWRGRPYEESNP
jgi:4-hydroxybenzoate polyprenyltransferase/GT2 family glycosyltransferase